MVQCLSVLALPTSSLLYPALPCPTHLVLLYSTHPALPCPANPALPYSTLPYQPCPTLPYQSCPTLPYQPCPALPYPALGSRKQPHNPKGRAAESLALGSWPIGNGIWSKGGLGCTMQRLKSHQCPAGIPPSVIADFYSLYCVTVNFRG